MARKQDERKRGVPPIQLRLADNAAQIVQHGWAGTAGTGSLGGGWGFTAALGGLGGKVAVALLLGALGVGAFGVGKALAPREEQGYASLRAFEHPRGHDVAAVKPAASAPVQSSMQIVPESLDGKTDAQRAAEEAAARAEAERQARAAAAPAADAAGQAAAAAGADAAGPAPESKKGSFSQKFGELSKFGAGHGALNGGTGLSGGIGRSFSQGTLGASKGMGRGATARVQARSAQPRVNAHGRGFAYRQLDRANGLSRAGAASSGESSKALADSAFTGAPQSGNVVTGGGAGTLPATGAGAASNPVQPQSSQSPNNGTSAPADASHKNSSPWQMMVMAGIAALALGALLLTFAQRTISAGKKMFKTPDPTGQTKLAAIAMIKQGKMMAMLAAALGAIGIGIGLAMWQQFHQKSYGIIFIAGGGLLVALAMMIMSKSEDKEAGEQEESDVNANTTNARTEMAETSGKVSSSAGAGNVPMPQPRPVNIPTGALDLKIPGNVA